MSKAIQWLLSLDFIPRGWLTVLAGFAAILTGLACLTGVAEATGLSCAADPWTMIVGGAAAIGLGRRKPS